MGETPKQIKMFVPQKQHQVKTSSSFLASTLPQQEEVMQESFLSKSLTFENKPEKVWGKEGFLGPKGATKWKPQSSEQNLSTSLFTSPTTSNNPPTLNEALQNFLVIDESTKEDRAMLDMMNDMLMTSQSDSDVTDTVSPYRLPKTNDENKF